jgi:CRP/FNR family transcriptional regulator
VFAVPKRSSNDIGRERETAVSTNIDLQEKFGSLGVVRSYGPGSELLQQGLPADEIYLIHEGIVKLVWTGNQGKQTILGLRWPGYPLGVPSAITGDVCPMSAVPLVRSVLQRIPVRDFLRHMQADPALAWKVQQVHSKELCEHLNALGELACCSARSRLASVFKRFISAGQGRVEGKKTRLQLPLKQREVAELVGITPEHLSRILNALSKDGLLHMRKGWIIIPNPQELSML